MVLRKRLLLCSDAVVLKVLSRGVLVCGVHSRSPHHTVRTFFNSLFFCYGVYKFLNIIQFDQYDKRNQCQISGKGQSKINQFNNIIMSILDLGA